MSTEPNAPSAGTPGYETRDANAASLVKLIIGLAFTLVVTFAGMWWLMQYFGRVQPLGPAAAPFQALRERQLPPLPRIQVQPVHELEEVRDQQRQVVDSYGWVDRAHGVVHIPIEQAMDMIFSRGGLPARQTTGAAGSDAPAKAKSGKGTP